MSIEFIVSYRIVMPFLSHFGTIAVIVVGNDGGGGDGDVCFHISKW